MAYDKIIDSAKLDAALAASADAIREKTGDTAAIQWNESTGFADTILQIQSGSSVPDTCTVDVSITDGYLVGIVYTAIENDKIVGNSIKFTKTDNIIQQTLNNVLCGSAIFVYSSQRVSTKLTNAEYIGSAFISGQQYAYKITASAGDITTIQIVGD